MVKKHSIPEEQKDFGSDDELDEFGLENSENDSDAPVMVKKEVAQKKFETQAKLEKTT